MHQPVLAQDELPLPVQEIEAVLPRLFDDLAQLARWQRADRGFRMHARAEQHLVLDDVAHAGKDVLVQQRVADQGVRVFLQFPARQSGIPRGIHHVAAPVVGVLQRAFDVLHRRGIDVELAVVELQRYPRRGRLALIDAVAAEHQHVHAQAEASELDQEMLAPAAQGDHATAFHAGQVERAVARRQAHGLPTELRRRLAQDDDGRTFRHGRPPGGMRRQGCPAAVPRW